MHGISSPERSIGQLCSCPNFSYFKSEFYRFQVKDVTVDVTVGSDELGQYVGSGELRN